MAYQLDTPVICTDVGGLAEVVPHEVSGFIVPPGDAAALAREIVRFYEEGWEERLRTGVREQKRKYGWDPLVAAIEAFAAQPGGGPAGRAREIESPEGRAREGRALEDEARQAEEEA